VLTIWVAGGASTVALPEVNRYCVQHASVNIGTRPGNRGDVLRPSGCHGAPTVCFLCVSTGVRGVTNIFHGAFVYFFSCPQSGGMLADGHLNRRMLNLFACKDKLSQRVFTDTSKCLHRNCLLRMLPRGGGPIGEALLQTGDRRGVSIPQLKG
jgi:hypothetical protein